MSGLIHKLVSGKYANTFDGGDVQDLNITGTLTYSNNPVQNGMLMTNASGVVTSMRAPMCDIYWEGNTLSTDFVLAEYGTFKKLVVDNLTTLSPFRTGDWSLNSVENRLQYTGMMIGGVAHIAATFSLQGSANNHECFVQIHKNGTKVAGSFVRVNLRNNNPTTGVIHCFTSMEPNDFLEIFATTNPSEGTDNLNITASDANLFAMIM